MYHEHTNLAVARSDALLQVRWAALTLCRPRERIPVLSRDEEADLAHRFSRKTIWKAARHLVLSHLRFVLHIARGYSAMACPLATWCRRQCRADEGREAF